MQELTDNEIVELVNQGGTRAFELLISRYNQRLYRIIRIYIKDETDVEDLMQETYLSCFEQLSTFRHQAAFSTWMIRIAINKALMHKRKERRWSVLMTNISELFAFPDNQSDQGNPEETLISLETKMQLERLVGKLPKMYREVFILSQLVHMSTLDIATCLSISEENVRVRLFRAKQLLKKQIEPALRQKCLIHFW